ncbi:23287_t:CDS:2, partial [Racocetra persica]
ISRSYLNSFAYAECEQGFNNNEHGWLKYLNQNNDQLNSYYKIYEKYSEYIKYKYFWIGYEGQDVLFIDDFPNNIYEKSCLDVGTDTIM